MSVYIDNYFASYQGMLMAEKLGVRKWFQDTGTPHYDICKSKRDKAIKLGAIPEGVLEGARRRLKAKRKAKLTEDLNR